MQHPRPSTVLNRVSGIRLVGSDPGPEVGASETEGLSKLDSLLRDRPSGVIAVDVPDADTGAAVASHIARRALTFSGRVHEVVTDSVDSVWCEAARMLGTTIGAFDPDATADAIVDYSDVAWVVVHGNRLTNEWDRAVFRSLARRTPRGHVLVITPDASHMVRGSLGTKALTVVVNGEEEGATWLQGIVEELSSVAPSRSLFELDRWWRSGEAARILDASTVQPLGAAAQQLVGNLSLARHAWPAHAMNDLAPVEAWQDAINAGAVRVVGSWLSLNPRAEQAAQDASAQEQQQMAALLVSRMSDDPWAIARGSLLFLRSGDMAKALDSLASVLRLGVHATIRHDIWSAWRRELADERADAISGQVVFEVANQALSSRDLDDAVSFAREAMRRGWDGQGAVSLLVGEALLGTGDLVGASVALQAAVPSGASDDVRWKATALLSEVALWDGRRQDAERLAASVIESAADPRALMAAHNVLGKLELARGNWQQAQEIFAQDESIADVRQWFEEKARARINRSIALLSQGDSDAARQLLEEIASSGEATKHLRVHALARINLAVVAHLDARYAEALQEYERALELARALGDRLVFVRPALDLADLRLQMGLNEEARQALRFARRVCSTGVPAALLPQVWMLEAEVLLRDGKSQAAREAVRKALGKLSSVTHGARAGECYRLLARVELHEGHVAAAKRALRAAEKTENTVGAKLKNVELQMQVARADGSLDQAERARQVALELVEDVDDRELQRSVLVTVAELGVVLGAVAESRKALQSAFRAYRDVTAKLPAFLIRSMERRGDIRRMRELESKLKNETPATASNGQALTGVGGATRSPDGSTRDSTIVGSHPSIQRLRTIAVKVAQSSSAPVLVYGESGTGKELVAEAIHRASDRHDKPLVKVNCAALVENLLLSELFGHEKGAFTGASSRKRGRFELAEGGTLFLDEIGDISPKTQVALLRVLQDGTFDRVGGNQTVRVNVRVVCATHRNLAELVDQGKFREDLYYRLSGLVLTVPALRDRGADIETLSRYILAQIAKERAHSGWELPAESVEVLRSHSWPGNVRELQNVLRAATLFADGNVLDVSVIKEQIRPSLGRETSSSADGQESPPVDADPNQLAFDWIRRGRSSLPEMKRALERACIVQALGETDGNITRAAQLLGMKRPRLSQIVKEMGLQKKRAQS